MPRDSDQRLRATEEANVILGGPEPRQQGERQYYSATLRYLGLYLAFTLPMAGLAALHGASPAVAIAHAAALVVVWRQHSARATATHPVSFLAGWAPLLLMPFLYAEVPLLIAGAGTPFHDATVQQWENGLFGVSPAATLAAAWPSRALSELLHAGYLTYYPMIFLPPLLLYLRGRRAAFERVVAAVVSAFLICFVIFVTFPVEGPRYQWGAPAGVPMGFVRRITLALLQAGSARGSAFPSSHVAVAVTQTWLALKLQRPVGVVCAILTALLATGAVYGGFHYAVDILAGAFVGICVGAVVGWSRR